MTQFPFGGQQATPFAPQAPQFQQAPQFAPPPQFAPQQPAFPTPPAYPQQQFAPQAPPAPYGQQYGQPFYQQPQAPQAPAQQAPAGSLDAFYGQPKTGRPPAISWKGKPDGTTIAGVVLEDATDKDVVADVDPQTKQLKTFRDGSPQYSLVLTLQVQPSQEHPDGRASLWCRGDLWEKLAAAMKTAGRSGAPKAGDVIYVSLVERRQGRGTIPRNVFAVQYAAQGQDAPQAPAQPPAAPQWEQPPAAPQWEQPPAQAPVAPQPPAQPAAPQAPTAPPAPAQAPGWPQAPTQFAPAPQTPQAPQAPALPGGMTLSPEQQALLAQLKGQA